ncbi:MAG: hypothetical protein JJU13_11270 [Balneolaceae bacterium]|nr:hypothetical protein [Balneolaceae bacterium]
MFFHQVKEYHHLTKMMAIHKRQLGDGLRHWGINIKLTRADYHRPEQILSGLDKELLRQEFAQKMLTLGLLIERKEQKKPGVMVHFCEVYKKIIAGSINI